MYGVVGSEAAARRCEGAREGEMEGLENVSDSMHVGETPRAKKNNAFRTANTIEASSQFQEFSCFLLAIHRELVSADAVATSPRHDEDDLFLYHEVSR